MWQTKSLTTAYTNYKALKCQCDFVFQFFRYLCCVLLHISNTSAGKHATQLATFIFPVEGIQHSYFIYAKGYCSGCKY